MASERWLEASEVIPMFPTLVWKFLLEAGLRSAIDAKILATLERMRRELPKLAPGQGWQSEQTLHGREEFGQLAACVGNAAKSILRSEEHTSELQSRVDLVCRLLLEKK